MKYLLCIFLPPLAVLNTGRPFSALLNAFLTLLFWVPGIIHAVIVVNADRDEEKHAEMLSAITGQPVLAKRSEEAKVFKALMSAAGLILTGLVVLALIAPPAKPKATAEEVKTAPAQVLTQETVQVEQPEKKVDLQAEMEGKSYAQIVGMHGEPTSKDAATGWAEWPSFRARFVATKAVEIAVK